MQKAKAYKVMMQLFVLEGLVQFLYAMLFSRRL